MRQYRFFTTADVISTEKIYDYKKESKKVLASINSKDKDLFKEVKTWLPQASKTYKISSNLDDYVLVEVCIMCSDIPNRNAVAFPLKELTAFNPDTGCLGYQTWKGKPTFVEHKNDILENAKGVIFDSFIKDAPEFKGDICKIYLLAGFDKTKDPQLCSEILSGKRNCYSMGSYSDDFQCSICGKLLSKGGCSHSDPNHPKMEIIDGKLAFSNVCGMMGFELSSVLTPAFVTAETNKILELSNIK